MAPMIPAPTQGSVTFLAHSQSDMPRAIAPSRGRIGTPRIRSREVAAMIGSTITARMRPEVSRPWPLPVLPPTKPSQDGAWLARIGAMSWAMNGPKVSAPHRPMITLGTPASSSRNRPITLAIRRGSRSTITSAAPMDTGTAMISAMAEVARVPRISGSAPNSSPELCRMPLVRTGAPYCEPKFQVVPVKMCQPLNCTAGIALTMSVTSTNTSISRGMTAPPSPSQRIGSAFDRRARSTPRRREGGKPAPPSGCTVGAEAATQVTR